MVQLSPVRPDHLPYLNIPLIALPHPCGSAGSRFSLGGGPRRRIWPVPLQARPRSADQTPVAGPRLPKMGIFGCPAGAFRRFRPERVEIGGVETKDQFAKARHWRAF